MFEFVSNFILPPTESMTNTEWSWKGEKVFEMFSLLNRWTDDSKFWLNQYKK